jgi:aminopeptidase N
VLQRLLVLALAVVAAIAAAMLTARYMSTSPPPELEPGIPRTLADDRAVRIHHLRYDVTFRVPEARSDPVRGNVVAMFTLTDASRPIAFDFAQEPDHLVTVAANRQVVAAAVEHQHVVIPAEALVEGENAIEIEFIAGDEALNRNDDFLYALFVPARASLAMPVFDQPNLKARWRLMLSVPSGWTAVSNGRESGRATAEDRESVIFNETAPIPTYLFSFAAGRFSVESAVRDERVFRMYHRETDQDRLDRNRDVVFDLHARALAWLERYTGIPYPFEKFDFVLIPSFQFGGMEHPGAVFYNASGLLLDEAATKNQELGRASVIAHETAHMWFGDLVTMRWFNDVWMKEVFANFMAAKIVNPSFPDVNHDLRFLYAHYPAAYGVDRTVGANPIRQPLDNLNEAGSLYGAIIYQKAPIVMRQLELLIGEAAMQEGLREYLSMYALGNATWTDLVRLLDARTDVDLGAWSQAWVEEAGRPEIRTVIEIDDGRMARLAFAQTDPRGRGLVWPQRLTVMVSAGGAVHEFDVTLADGETEVAGAAGLPAPDWVLPVGDGLGYGQFILDAATLVYLGVSLHELDDPLTRGAALVALWEAMLDGQVPPDRVLRQLMTALPAETDELTLQQMLGYLRTLYWRFTPADARRAHAPEIERLLRTGLDDARTSGTKAAWFSAVTSVATTPATVQWMEELWRRNVTIPGLPLSENDEIGLALDLAVRDVAAAPEILATQLERIDNPDRKARFEFVMPALSSDEAARDQFFESLADVRNRGREAWVLEAVRYLHHPLRAAASRKHVVAALELVREIQRTGDIFFPKRWADATLGGYQSVQTAAEVRAFIESLPSDYPPRLRWVLLSAADDLFRAARMLN